MAIRQGNSLYWKSGIDNSGLKSGIAEGRGLLKNFSSQVTGFDVFAGLGVSAGIAFTKMSKDGFEFSKQFQSAMKEVQTISFAVQDNYEGISDSIVDMSKKVPDSAIALTKAYYQIVSAGYDGAKGLSVLEAASKAATAGVTDTITAADGMTTILNAWKMDAEEVGRVSDLMFTTVRLGKTTFEELSRSMAQVAPIASSMSIPLEQVTGMVATLTKQGIPTSEAMTRLRAAILGLNKALGDGWSESMTLQEAFIAVKEAAGGSDTELQKLIGSQEGMIAVLAATGKNAQGAAEDLNAMSDAVGATDTAFRTMNESADVQLKILGNNLKAKMKEYGDSLLDLAGSFAMNVNELLKTDADKFGEVSKKVSGLEKDLQPLIDRYKVLSTQSNLTNEEQLELKSLIEKIAGVVPSAVTQFDAYGNAMGISAGKAEEFIASQKRLAQYFNREAIKENEKALKKLEDQIYFAHQKANARTKTEMGYMMSYTVEKSDEEIMADVEKLKELQRQAEEVRKLISDLKGETTFEETPDPNPNPNPLPGGTVDSNAKTALEEFQDKIAIAKNAWEEYEQLRKAGLLDEVKTEYDIYLEKGRTWVEYLNTLKEDYKNHVQELKEINLALVEAGVTNSTPLEEIKEIQKLVNNVVAESIKKPSEKAADYLESTLEDVDAQIAIEPDIDLKKAAAELKKFAASQELKRISEAFENIGGAISQSADVFGQFDEQLGDIVYDLGTTVSGIGQLTAGLATGNVFGAISGGLTALTSLIHLFKKDEKTFEEIHQEKIEILNKSIDRTNSLLEYQLDLLGRLEGTEWLGASRTTISDLTNQLAMLEKQILSTNVQGVASWGSLSNIYDIDTSHFTLEDFIKMAAGGEGNYNSIFNMNSARMLQGIAPGSGGLYGTTLKFDEEALKLLTDQYQNLLEMKTDLLNELNAELTGTSKDSLVNAIASGFSEGESSIAYFADSFEEAMKQSVVNTFKRQFLDKQLQGFYDAFASYSESGGQLTSTEIESLRSTWDSMIEQSQAGWEALTEGLGLNFGDLLGEGGSQKGIAGAIKGVTEETAGIIAGQIGSIRINALESLNTVRNIETEIRQINVNTKELFAIRSLLESQNSLTSERALGR